MQHENSRKKRINSKRIKSKINQQQVAQVLEHLSSYFFVLRRQKQHVCIRRSELLLLFHPVDDAGRCRQCGTCLRMKHSFSSWRNCSKPNVSKWGASFMRWLAPKNTAREGKSFSLLPEMYSNSATVRWFLETYLLQRWKAKQSSLL